MLAIRSTGRPSRPTPLLGRRCRGTAQPTNSTSTPTTSTSMSATRTSCSLRVPLEYLDETLPHTHIASTAGRLRLSPGRLGDAYSRERPHRLCAHLPVASPGLQHGDCLHRSCRP